MEYGTKIDTGCYDYMIDQNYNRYVGWQEASCSCKELFSPHTIKLISSKITELTEGVDDKNRKIVVPDQTIINVLNFYQDNYRPPTGDIYGRLNVPKKDPTDYNQDVINETIERIVSDIKVNMGMAQNNAKLTAWTTVYGEFNEHGLRAVAPLTGNIRNKKRPAPMQFNMNY
jgi:hypothetical protein